MDSFDDPNSDNEDEFAGPGVKEAAEQALMNEDLDASPLVPADAMTQQQHVYNPSQEHYNNIGMSIPPSMAPIGHVGMPNTNMPPHIPMPVGQTMPPSPHGNGYPGAPVPPFARPGVPGFHLSVVSGMPDVGGSGMMNHGNYSGIMHGVPAMFPFPMQGERDNGTTNKRSLDEEELERPPSPWPSEDDCVPQEGKRLRVSQEMVAPTAIQSPQVEASQHDLDSKLQPHATNDASYLTRPAAVVPEADQGLNGSSKHEAPLPAAPKLSSIDDDIFADADDDDGPIAAASTDVTTSAAPAANLELPSNNLKTSPRANYQSQALSPDQRPSIRNIVLGNAGKAILPAAKDQRPSIRSIVLGNAGKAIEPSVAAKKTTNVPNVAAKKTNNVKSAVGRVGERKKVSSKRKSKPTRKVLIARKEKEQATTLLEGIEDLLERLPKEDCKFLAESFWIFTTNQLQWVLTQSPDQEEGVVPDVSAKDDTTIVKASHLRDEILLKLATSKLLRPSGAGDKEQLQLRSTEAATAQVEKDPGEVPGLPAAADTNGGSKSHHQATDAELSAVSDKPNMDNKTSESAEALSTQDAVAGGTAGVDGKAQSCLLTEKDADKKAEGNRGLSNDEVAAALSGLDKAERRTAEARMETWRELIGKTKTPKSIDEQFPVDGPIGCLLLPVATRNFLASIPIKSLHGFLSLKKTETGAICEMFRIWRRNCDLSDMAALALGRHLISLASRIERALSSSPPIVDADTRQWMLDPIVVLTGAARDFLVLDQKIYSATDFLEMRTKDLAMKLEIWRERQSMVPLKGSGKVAMISAWKAGAKEAIEAEKDFGKVLHGVDLESEAFAAADLLIVKDEALDPVLPEPVASGPKEASTEITTKPSDQKATKHPRQATVEQPTAPPETDRHFKYTLHSTMFLEDIAGKATYELLSSVGVKTAAELFDADKTEGSRLSRAVIDAKRASNSSECKSVIDEWCRLLRSQLDLFRSNLPTVASPPPKIIAALPLKRVSTPPPKSAKAPPQKKAKIAKIKAAGASSRVVVRTISRALGDPFDGLSAVTKRFLATMNITTAEKFLSSRTTDISVNFVHWRIKENMPELKGLGAIASVSGWKAQVRKFAKEMGLEQVADMEPANKASWGKEAREASRKEAREAPPRRRIRTKPTAPSAHTLSHEDVLFGNSRRIFAVQDESDSKVQYRFELSVRRLDKDTLVGLFATYKGAALQNSDGAVAPKSYSVRIEGSASDSSRSRVGVLSDIPVSAIGQKGDSCVPFKTLMTGRGLVELRRYGVHPLQVQELALLKEELKTFVLFGDIVRPSKGARVGEANVLIHDGAKGEFQYLLCLDTPIEKGQTISLRFPDVSTMLGSDKYDHTSFRVRHLINSALHALARHDLRTIRTFFREELFEACGLLSDASDEASIVRMRQVVASRQRLHWISLRVLSLIDDQTTKENLTGLCFDWKTFITDPKLLDSLPENTRLDLKQVMACELKKELLATLELDHVCGSASRADWCRLFSKLFDTLVEGLVSQYCCSAVEPDQCSEAITTIFENSYSTPLSGDNLGECILQFRPSGTLAEDEASHGSPAEPSSAFYSSIRQAFLDTTSLSGESADDLTEPGCLEMIICDGPLLSESGGMATVATRRPADVQKGDAVLNARWYRKHQWEISSTVLSCFASLIGPTDNAWFDAEKIRSAMREVANKQIDTSSLPDHGGESCSLLRLPAPPVDPESQIYEPHSLQFFLGLVWPALSKLQWRLEAGDSPSEVAYFAPGLVGRSGKLAKLLKKENDRKRAQLAREVHEVGLGFVPKLTKRLLVKAVSVGKDEKDALKEENSLLSDSKRVGEEGMSVRDVLGRFLDHLNSRLKTDDQGGRDRANSIVVSMRNCFDALAPKISDAKVVSEMEASSGQQPSDVLGCDALMQFLLVIPSVLRQPSLPLKEINDTLAAVQELTDFVASNYVVLLDDHFHPPPEHYVGQHQANSSALISRLRRLDDSAEGAIGSATSREGLHDIFLASDKAKLTDYLVRVLEQATPCGATFEDSQKKGRNLEEGFPGVTCRYCLGTGGEGRYFFKTAESLSASASILDKHFAKCPCVPADIKADIAMCKRRHTDQRKNLTVGAQQEFFLRLWERMQSSKSSGGFPSNVYVSQNVGNSLGETATEDSAQDSETGNVEFRDHIGLLDFVRTTEPWKNDNGLQEALEQYYNCLDYGGRIFGTNAMPKNFNSEWLLAKVSPKGRSR